MSARTDRSAGSGIARRIWLRFEGVGLLRMLLAQSLARPMLARVRVSVLTGAEFRLGLVVAQLNALPMTAQGRAAALLLIEPLLLRLSILVMLGAQIPVSLLVPIGDESALG